MDEWFWVTVEVSISCLLELMNERQNILKQRWCIYDKKPNSLKYKEEKKDQILTY